MGHLQKDCPNTRAFTAREWDEIEGRTGKRAMIVLTSDGEEILKYPPVRGGGDGAYQLNLLGEMERIPNEDSEGEAESGAKSDISEEEHEVLHPEEPHSLLVRKNFHAAGQDKQHEQRENIFRTKCKVQDEVCDIIIDSGSETNCIDSGLVERLKLETHNHPRPYKLHWIDDQTGPRVRKQCLVNFKIGTYSDEVLCDVLRMDACQILLGRPWQHDRKTQFDGYSNIYTIVDNGKKKDLLPLPPHRIFTPKKESREASSSKQQKSRDTSTKKERGAETDPGGSKTSDLSRGEFKRTLFQAAHRNRPECPGEIFTTNFVCQNLVADQFRKTNKRNIPEKERINLRGAQFDPGDASELRTILFEEGEDEPSSGSSPILSRIV